MPIHTRTKQTIKIMKMTSRFSIIPLSVGEYEIVWKRIESSS